MAIAIGGCALQQAQRECRAEGWSPGEDGYTACVHDGTAQGATQPTRLMGIGDEQPPQPWLCRTNPFGLGPMPSVTLCQ